MQQIYLTTAPVNLLTTVPPMRYSSLSQALVHFGLEWAYYVWLAIDRQTREIIGYLIGDRSRQSARKLWESMPPVYRQCAVAYTDFWKAYEKVIPSKRRRAVGKESGQTNHIERLNNTLRQRISRLVKHSLSFSKNVENHVGVILCFI